MDPVMDRVRAADPVRPGEFAGLDDFDALLARLEPPRPRRRRRLLALPAAGAIVAALVFLPASAPQASEIARRASAAIQPEAGILYAESSAQSVGTHGEVTNYGTRRVWLHGASMRRINGDGAEEVSANGMTVRIDPKTGEIDRRDGLWMVPGEIFRANELLRAARAGGDVELGADETVDGRLCYVLKLKVRSGPPHFPRIEQVLWVDRETYAPVRFMDHSWGRDASGKQFETTFTERVHTFKTLPDTPENRRLLELKA